MIYLATPFTNYPLGHFVAFCEAARIAGALAKRGHSIFSPIVHSYPLAMFSELPLIDAKVWAEINAPFLDRCDEIFVAKLAGWKTSKGVQAEVSYFLNRNLPISFVDPVTFNIEQGISASEPEALSA